MNAKVAKEHDSQPEPKASVPHSTTTGQRLLEWTDSLIAQVPPEAWDDLPTDLAKNLDHYLYGSPKEP